MSWTCFASPVITPRGNREKREKRGSCSGKESASEGAGGESTFGHVTHTALAQEVCDVSKCFPGCYVGDGWAQVPRPLSGLFCRGLSGLFCRGLSVSLSPSLSVSQSPCLSLHVPLRPLVSLSLCLSLGPHPRVCVAVSPSLAFWNYLCGEGQRLTKRLAWVRHG